jgi:ubiquitin C-terminal hydrolase
MAFSLPSTSNSVPDGGVVLQQIEPSASSSSSGIEQQASWPMDVGYQSVGPLVVVLPQSEASTPEPLRESYNFSNNTIGAGLRNLGNTCFLNAVLQCMTYTPPLVESLRNWNHKIPCKIEGFCAFCALQEHVELSLSSMGEIIAPWDLVNNLSNMSTSFQRWEQEDAHEYMHCLLEDLHNCALGPEPSNSCLCFEGNTFIKKIFGGCLRSQIKCMNCLYCSDTFERSIDLSLAINEVDSLTDALKSFTKVETVDDVNHACEHCCQPVQVLKQLTVSQLPNVLMVHLKRFIGYGFSSEKVHKIIEYPRVLDMEPFVSDTQLNQGQLKYELYAVLVHSGYTLDFGHYYCFVRSSLDSWYEMDDCQVNKVSERTVLDQQAYVLFYFRQGSPWFSCGLEPEVMSELKIIDSPKSIVEEAVTSNCSNSPPSESSGDFSEVDAGISVGMHLDGKLEMLLTGIMKDMESPDADYLPRKATFSNIHASATVSDSDASTSSIISDGELACSTKFSQCSGIHIKMDKESLRSEDKHRDDPQDSELSPKGTCGDSMLPYLTPDVKSTKIQGSGKKRFAPKTGPLKRKQKKK